LYSCFTLSKATLEVKCAGAVNSKLAKKGEETIEDIFKQLLPHGKPNCTTFLQENETIDTATNRLATSEEL
jgi:hypothetical protein